MPRMFIGLICTAVLAIPVLATPQTRPVKTPEVSPASLASAAPQCRIPGSAIRFNPAEIFDRNHGCYPKDGGCPAEGSVCMNHAIIKMADYNAPSGQDLIYSPHRGLWGQNYGSTDPDFVGKPAPGQNTNDAFKLIWSFTDDPRYRHNVQGRDYGSFLRGQLVELDMTTTGDDIRVQEQPNVIVDHYLTTDNTSGGTLNEYLTLISDAMLANWPGTMQRRDFTASPMKMKDTPVAKVTKDVIVQPGGRGLVTFHDIKARRGDMQCQVFGLTPKSPLYDRYNCGFNDPQKSTEQELRAQVLSARAMASAGGSTHVVIKTTATYDDMVQAFMRYGKLGRDQAKAEMRRYMWQPHPTGDIQAYVQYMHDWLVNGARSVEAWEFNIRFADDKTNQRFCVTSYDPRSWPYGKITTRTLPAKDDGQDCQFGPYVNMLDYIRLNMGNPDYFGFTEAQKKERLISGNRANLWLLDTAAPIGTSDRYYRWQMLGSERTYNMSDIVRYLSYPYVTYQIINADRLDVVHQAIEKGLYPSHPKVNGAIPFSSAAAFSNLPEADQREEH